MAGGAEGRLSVTENAEISIYFYVSKMKSSLENESIRQQDGITKGRVPITSPLTLSLILIKRVTAN